jgi:hypothetical protein
MFHPIKAVASGVWGGFRLQISAETQKYPLINHHVFPFRMTSWGV